MARALQQPYSSDSSDSEDWTSLRQELVALLDQVDSQVTRNQREASLSERVRDLRHQVVEAEGANPQMRHRDALRQVQRAITRFEEQPLPANPRDTLEAAISQIRARQGEAPRMPNAIPPQARGDGLTLDKLVSSFNGLSNRLERLEVEIKAQVKSGADVKDVADQVAQLAHVVELLAGAVGETGQVKRLEGQIASLGKIMAQGREMDSATLTRRLDDVATTLGRLADLQVHFADKVQSPVEQGAFQNGMAAIEEGVRAIYDRIDAIEKRESMSPAELEHVTAEMARFTEAMRDNAAGPRGLIELIDALNTRIADIESGDRLMHALRKDLTALRDAVVVSLAPRFDAIETRIDSIGKAMSTQEDMAEIGRQIGALGDRIGERAIDPGLGQLEAQVRQLVARMDQTGEQLSGLAKLYSGEPSAAVPPDLEAMSDMVAMKTYEAMQRHGMPDSNVSGSIAALEARIATMLQTMHRDPELDEFGPMQVGISEVNERLRRIETSLLGRKSTSEPMPSTMEPELDLTPLHVPAPMPARPVTRPDTMPRSPVDEAPLNAPPFPAPSPTGPVQDELSKQASRKRHPGLAEDVSLAERYEAPPVKPIPHPEFESSKVELPPAPTPSFDMVEPSSSAAEPAAQVSTSSRNTFIEAARRAAQRQTPTKAEPSSNSLIGRALARFQVGEAKPEMTSRVLGAKPTSKPVAIEPVPAPVAPVVDAPAAKIKPARAAKAPRLKPEPMPRAEGESDRPSFLVRNSKVILLACAVVALGFLTLNLVRQRMAAQPPAPAADVAPVVEPAPATTGSIDAVAEPSASSASIPPRVIPMVDSLKTGSIDQSAAQGFTTTPVQTMPRAFQAATGLAADADASAPTEAGPVKVELPPESVGSIDLRQAAADGDARAQFEVAAIYTEGRAVAQDYKAAATWYERAAAQGFAPAQYRLGSLYESGDGVTKDLTSARLWYERAAEAGNRMSMHNLASLYAGGQLGKQQFDSAARWFEEAASRGLVDSQFNLGMLYARGLGVEQSLEQSYKWFGIAALSGDKDAAKARDDMAKSLDADTVQKLTAEIAAFKPAPIDMKANFAPIGTWSKTFDPGETISAKDIVASVQRALGKLGYDAGTPDGVFGPKTSDAIKSFEGATGMSEIGQINPRLLAVLGSQPV